MYNAKWVVWWMDNRNSIVNIIHTSSAWKFVRTHKKCAIYLNFEILRINCSTGDACFWDIMIVLTSIDLSPFLEFNKETNPSKIYLVLPIFIVFHSFSKLQDSITLQTLKCIGELTNFQYNISSWLKYILYFMKPSCKLLKFRYFAWFF